MAYTRPKIRIPVPVRRPFGLGDVVHGATKLVGIQPCQPCQRRRRKLNQLVGFGPPRWRR